MKHSTLKLAIMPAVGAALLASASVQAGIQGSKHDFTASGAGQGASSSATEICVFCHTPHGSDTAAPAPLWNRFLDTTKTYTRYSALGTATLDGDEAPVGSVTLACLSCHDGSQAMDSVINAPGSGGYNVSGSDINAGLTSMSGEPIPMLGNDLRNDHPVSIQYAGGGCNTTTGDCGGTDFSDPDFNTALYASINSKDNWWVETGGNTTRDKTDMVLYTRSDGPNSTLEPFVECASCHDPHNITGGATDVQFLRISNEGSAVCLACHDK